MSVKPAINGEQLDSRWSAKQLARAAGLFYVLLVIFGGVAHVYVRGRVYVADNPTETARLVMEHAALVRAGVLIDVFAALAFLLVGLTLYEFFAMLTALLLG